MLDAFFIRRHGACHFLYGNDETEFLKSLNFVKPQLIAFARASHELADKLADAVQSYLPVHVDRLRPTAYHGAS